MSFVSSPFGSNTRTAILLLLSRRGQAHVRLLARLLDVPLSVVQHALRSLEADGLVACRREGRIRQVFLSPAYPAHEELLKYLCRLADLEPELNAKGRQPAA
jgi:DNA-binding transcriptional ArsR family regulator